MSAPPSLDASVLIATYKRSRLLGEALDAIAAMRVSRALRWEVIVIDNNSPDDTRAVVEARQASYPVPLVYLLERQQGRTSALNAGITAARGRVIAFTDDDQRPLDGWLDAACEALSAGVPGRMYAAGPIRPIWEEPPPAWLDLTRGDLWGTVGIHDHGPEPFVYEDRRKVPMAGNIAILKSVLDTIGGFRADLGRTADTRVLLGQELPELLNRLHEAGGHGAYEPRMELEHHIPALRLTRPYFRKWWYGRGVSRALLEQSRPVTEMGLDLARVPHLLDVPRFMYGTALRDVIGIVREHLAGRRSAAFRHEMSLVYFAGYFLARLRQRGLGRSAHQARPTTVSLRVGGGRRS